VTLFGWDASDFDWARGPMDLVAAKADGITWFTHKATESTNVRHARLADALNRARAAGFEFLGAYHVVRSSPSVQAQVDYFLGTLDQQVPWWRDFPGFMLQVDLELWPYDQVSAATGIAFANALVAAQPKQVLTYASRGMYGNSLIGLPTPLWNAAYGNDPVVPYRQAYPGDNGIGWTPYSGQTPVMWQYGSRLTIGTQPGCDANAYRGSLTDLRQLITGTGTPESSRKATGMFRLIDPDNGQFVISPDSLSPTGWSYVQISPDLQGWMLVAAGIGTANGSANDPNHDPHANNNWRPGTFGPSVSQVRAQLLTDIAAKVVASLPPGQGGGPTLAQIAAAVRAELDRTTLPSVPGTLGH
jgi:GH25 family lysozyme M1 (1,4-beta-N-acetylmuramidase)